MIQIEIEIEIERRFIQAEKSRKYIHVYCFNESNKLYLQFGIEDLQLTVIVLSVSKFSLFVG